MIHYSCDKCKVTAQTLSVYTGVHLCLACQIEFNTLYKELDNEYQKKLTLMVNTFLRPPNVEIKESEDSVFVDKKDEGFE